MKKSIFVCVLMVAALLSGCTKGELATPQDGTARSIEAGDIVARSATVLDASAVETRQPYEGTISPTNPLQALVITTTTDHSYSDPVNKGIMTFTASNGDDILYEKPLPVGVGKFDDYAGSTTKEHYLTGFYPATGWTSGVTFTHPLDGKTDVMYTIPTGTTWADTQANGGPTLAFTHALTQLRLAFKKEQASSTILLNEVKLTGTTENLLTTLKCTMNTSTPATTLSFEGTNALPIFAYKKGTDNTLADENIDISITESELAYLLIPFVTTNNTELKFTVKYTENDTETTANNVIVNLNNSETTQGYAYMITFRFADGSCKGNATAATWTEVGLYDTDNPIDI
jgi:hypothetical protein